MGFYEFLLLLENFLIWEKWSWFEFQFRIESVIGEKGRKFRCFAYGII
jgi:hypothetical protein